jgi:hypothetical protein
LYPPISWIIAVCMLLGVQMCCFFYLVYPKGSRPSRRHRKEALTIDRERDLLIREAIRDRAALYKRNNQ